MTIVGIHEAKTHLSRLIAAIRAGTETEIIVASNGVPAARIVPLEKSRKAPLWGAAKGQWIVPDDIDRLNPEIEHLFDGDNA